MPRRLGGPTGLSAIEREMRAGRGQGNGEHYLPWLTVHNVPSQGQSGRVLGWKSGRVQHLLSQLEQRYQLLLDWSDSVTDVREQFPLLPIQETLEISEQLGVKHPQSKGQLVVMTTDFLVTQRIRLREIDVARTIKMVEELNNRRVLEKFEIERTYWARRNIDWGIVIDTDLPQDACHNIGRLHSYRSLNSLNPLPLETVQKVAHALAQLISQTDGQVMLAELCKDVDSRVGVTFGTALGVAYFLLANKVLKIDIRQRIYTDRLMNVSVGDFEHLWSPK